MIPILHICLSCCFSYKKVVFWPFDPGHIIYWGVCVREKERERKKYDFSRISHGHGIPWILGVIEGEESDKRQSLPCGDCHKMTESKKKKVMNVARALGVPRCPSKWEMRETELE